MGPESQDRRKTAHPIRMKPAPSPASLMVLGITGVLLAVAAASAFLGQTHDDATPHGQVLGDLHRVAVAQATHHAEHGTFARWTRTLDVRTHEEVNLTIVRADAEAWEAVATHAVGLSCARGGRIGADGKQVLDTPACYIQAER